MDAELDIIIPVYNEGANILRVLDSLRDHVRTPFRVLICYDQRRRRHPGCAPRDGQSRARHRLVKNRGRGPRRGPHWVRGEPCGPRCWCFQRTTITTPPGLTGWSTRSARGARSSRRAGSSPAGAWWAAPLLKATLVRTSAWALHHSHGCRPTTRATDSGFSRGGPGDDPDRIDRRIRLQYRAPGEVPPAGLEDRRGAGLLVRTEGGPEPVPGTQVASPVSQWFGYAFATTFLFRGPNTVVPDPPRSRGGTRATTLTNRKHLVIGGAGFIGTVLVTSLAREVEGLEPGEVSGLPPKGPAHEDGTQLAAPTGQGGRGAVLWSGKSPDDMIAELKAKGFRGHFIVSLPELRIVSA